MLEVKVNVEITAPQLATAISNLANALVIRGHMTEVATLADAQAKAQVNAQVSHVTAPAPVIPAPANNVTPITQPQQVAPVPQPIAQTAPMSGATVAPVPQPMPQTGAGTPMPQNTPVASTPAPVQPVTNVPLAPAPQYTIDQLQIAGAALMDAHKDEELKNLLYQFGVQAVTQLSPEQIGAFATAMRGLGAQI